jgi:D-alanine-D-alanine ligase
VLEVNTIPGFTERSLYPKAARKAGIAFPDLCHHLCHLAVQTPRFRPVVA